MVWDRLASAWLWRSALTANGALRERDRWGRKTSRARPIRAVARRYAAYGRDVGWRSGGRATLCGHGRNVELAGDPGGRATLSGPWTQTSNARPIKVTSRRFAPYRSRTSSGGASPIGLRRLRAPATPPSPPLDAPFAVDAERHENAGRQPAPRQSPPLNAPFAVKAERNDRAGATGTSPPVSTDFATLLRRPWPSRSRSSRTRARTSAARRTRSPRPRSTRARSATSRAGRTACARTAARMPVARSCTCTTTITTTSTRGPERPWPLSS